MSASIGYEKEIVRRHRRVGELHLRGDRFSHPLHQSQRHGVRSAVAHRTHRSDDANGVSTLTTIESSAKSRYNGVTFGLTRMVDPDFQFQANYTLSTDKSDDDNERDPFSFRYARAEPPRSRVQLQRPRSAAPLQPVDALPSPVGHLRQQPLQRLLGAADVGALRHQQPGHGRASDRAGRARLSERDDPASATRFAATTRT